jgi:hypothetical protein
VNQGRHWRHASKWFSYGLKDSKGEAKVLRLTFARTDAGRRFDILVNGQRIAEVELAADAAKEFYIRDYLLPLELVRSSGGKLWMTMKAKENSVAGGLYGLRLLR